MENQENQEKTTKNSDLPPPNSGDKKPLELNDDIIIIDDDGEYD